MSLVSSIPVLGLESVCLRKGCPWPRIFLCPWLWPRALCPRLHLWFLASNFISFTSYSKNITEAGLNFKIYATDYVTHIMPRLSKAKSVYLSYSSSIAFLDQRKIFCKLMLVVTSQIGTESNGGNSIFANKGKEEKYSEHLFITSSSSHIFNKTVKQAIKFDVHFRNFSKSVLICEFYFRQIMPLPLSIRFRRCFKEILLEIGFSEEMRRT